MSTAMMILVGFGLAFDVFYIAVNQGCVLGKVQFKNMTLMCLLVCGWQVVATGMGYGIANLVHISELKEEVKMVWALISALMFMTLGIIKIYINNHKTARPEVRQEIDFRKICAIASSTSIYTLIATIGCAWLEMDIVKVAIMICVMTIALVILGIYVGLRNGELNKRVYRSGGILLILNAIIVIADIYFI